jgi:hypothetical protein
MDDRESRKSLFQTGKTYRVKLNSAGFDRNMRLGESVVFKRSGYVPYDSSHVYSFFYDDGRETVWRLRDDEPVESYKATFEPI